MTTAVEYRQYAAECLEALKFTTTPEVKAALLLMAERWDRLAEYVERSSRIGLDIPEQRPLR